MTSQRSSPLRVLLIVDSLYWTIGHFAHQVKKDNPDIEAMICSQHVIRQFLKRYGKFPLSFDVVHFLNTKTMDAFLGHLPAVITLHHMDSSTHVKYLEDCDAVMTVSGQWMKYLSDIGIPLNKIGMVPFAVDHHQFFPASRDERSQIRRTLKIPEEAFVVGFSGRQTSNNDGRKGIDIFVEGVRKVYQEYSQLVTVIIGPGWHELVRQFHDAGITCVQVPYQVEHADIARLYRALDVYWVTSRIEGGPVPLLEAMASGISCISTPVGAALDLLKDKKNGFLVPFDSSESFAKITLQLVHNPDIKSGIGEAARATIIQERQWSQTKSNLLGLYELAIHNFNVCQTQDSSSKHNNLDVEESCSLSGPGHQGFDKDFNPKQSDWMMSCEYVRGTQMLIQLGEWRRVIQFVGLAVKADPQNLSIWPQVLAMIFRAWKKKLFPRRVVKTRT
ncbi:MAG: glycosyltransferase family 4 protein [Nitrospirales bacterium]